jgi:hypothetical protein
VPATYLPLLALDSPASADLSVCMVRRRIASEKRE